MAAYGQEVGRDILGRTVLGEAIALYRSENGRAVALADRGDVGDALLTGDERARADLVAGEAAVAADG